MDKKYMSLQWQTSLVINYIKQPPSQKEKTDTDTDTDGVGLIVARLCAFFLTDTDHG